MTKDDFDLLRMDSSPTMLGVTNPIPKALAGNSNTSNAITSFQRSIKRDTSVLNTLKGTNNWENWNTHTLAQAGMQDVADICDSAYCPKTNDERDLFRLKQTYMFAVLTDRL